MCFIQNTDYLFLLYAPDDFNLLLKLPFGISPVEPGFQSQANDIPEIESFMRKNCGLYFKKVSELAEFLK